MLVYEQQAIRDRDNHIYLSLLGMWMDFWEET